MKHLVLISRILLGLGFTIFGLNIISPFLSIPGPESGTLAAQFREAMLVSHYMTFVGALQLIGGLFVLSGRLTPLGLIILAPILVNISAYHIFLESGKGLGVGIVFTMLEVFLIFAYRRHFIPLLGLQATREK